MSQTSSRRINDTIQEISRLLADEGYPDLPVDKDPPIGDFAIICFPAAKKLKKKPHDIAIDVSKFIEQVKLVKSTSTENGYCNVDIDWDEISIDFLSELLSDSYGRGETKPEKILVEHTSANPTGPFHMGRARNPIIGDSIAKLLSYCGHDVRTEYYVNDTGRQAATLAYGLENFKADDETKIDHSLVECYRKASEELKNDESIRKLIYKKMELIESGDLEALNQVKEAAKVMLTGMKISLQELGAEAENYFHESDLIASGKVDIVIDELKTSKLSREENGAHYLDLHEENIAGRNQKFFFTRENGLSLYTTRDIAYHVEKFKDYDRAVNILGEDHKLQSKLLSIALREMNAPAPEALFYSFVNLPGGKMSTRAGRVVYLDDIMHQITELAKEKLSDSEVDVNALAKQIGIGALRYNILKVQAEKGFTFNIDEALNLQGDSAPFVMYSHARTCAILRNYNKELPTYALKEDLKESEIRLLRTLSKWPKVVERAAQNLAIHHIPNYAHKLASDFNQFYRDCTVIGSINETFRINLVNGCKKILKESLSILGIEAPERM